MSFVQHGRERQVVEVLVSNVIFQEPLLWQLLFQFFQALSIVLHTYHNDLLALLFFDVVDDLHFELIRYITVGKPGSFGNQQCGVAVWQFD